MVFLWLMLGVYAMHAQNLEMLDSVLNTQQNEIKNIKKVKISGYFQPEFQWAQSKGIKYPGGDFASAVDKRFSVRRARVKVAYHTEVYELVLVTENTEKGISLHDVFGSYTMNKVGLKYTAGIFPRPFGFEQSYSTLVHEGPERARFSTTMLPAEADLGFKVNYFKLKPFNFELGVYNGNATVADFDSYKDLVARISIDKKIKATKLSGGVSFYHGKVIQGTPYQYKTVQFQNNLVGYVLQDTLKNKKGDGALRQYVGADIQYAINSNLGTTTLRAEWINGTQPASSSTSDSPRSGTVANYDIYSRKFNSLSTYFLQNIGKTNLQLVVKYDWYDPNTDAEADDIGNNNKLNATDIKYNTLGLGFNYYLSNMRIMLYYEFIQNEKATHLNGYAEDLKDNVLTIRTQFKF